MVVKTHISPVLTTKEVAILLNVHINTVRRWSDQGILRTYRIGRRNDRRFPKEDVFNLLREFKIGGNGAKDK